MRANKLGDSKVRLGLNIYSKNEKRIDLGEIAEAIEKLGKWHIRHIFGDLEIQVSSQTDDVIIEDNGSVFFYRSLEREVISSEELKSILKEALKLINELKIDVKYKNEIGLSVHAKNAAEVYEKNKMSIKGFEQNIMHNFLTKVRSDRESLLAILIPVPEVIPLKVWG